MKYIYPIGTRIKYNGCFLADRDKKGTIVDYASEDVIYIVVPGSCLALKVFGNSEHRWTTFITDVEVLAQKNEQLLFDFMY